MPAAFASRLIACRPCAPASPDRKRLPSMPAQWRSTCSWRISPAVRPVLPRSSCVASCRIKRCASKTTKTSPSPMAPSIPAARMKIRTGTSVNTMSMAVTADRLRPRSVKTQSFKLDAGGASRVEITGIAKSESPRDLLAELEYRDANGETLTSATRIPLFPSAVLLAVKPDSWLLSKDGLKFTVQAVDVRRQTCGQCGS